MDKEKKSGIIQEGIMDKEIESFMGLDKERQEEKTIDISKDRTIEIKYSAIRMMLRRAFHFKGYSARQEFIWGLFPGLIAVVLMTSVLIHLLRVFNEGLTWVYGLMILFSPALVIINIIFVFGMIALFIRRFNDAKLHPFFALLPFLIIGGVLFLPLELHIKLLTTGGILMPFILLGLKPTNGTVLKTAKTWNHDAVVKALYSA